MDGRNLPDPFRGGCGHTDEQVRAEGSLLAVVIVGALAGMLGTGLVMLIVRLWSAAQTAVQG